VNPSSRTTRISIKSAVLFLSTIVVFSLLGQGTLAEGKQARRRLRDDAGLTVKFSDEMLSVKAINKPTAQLLRRIARVARIHIAVYGEPENSVSIEFENLRLDDALRRLLGRHDLVLLYKAIDDPNPGEPSARLTAVQVHVEAGGAVPTMEFSAGLAVDKRVAAKKRDKNKPKVKRKRNRKKKERAKQKSERAGSANEDSVEVLARLKTAAFDSDPNVRADALDELGMVEDESAALDILERVLREDTVAEVRATAISGLEDLDQVPVEPVLDAVLFDEAPEVRIGAMEIIGEQEWKDQRTVDTLSRVLEDPNEELRLAALEVLGELGERTVLENAAQSNAHQEIRELAMELLTVLKP